MNSLIHLVEDIKEIYKHQWEEVVLFLIQFSWCIANVIKWLLEVVVHKLIFQIGKKKKTTINPKNTDDKCFQYATTVALKYEEIKWNTDGVWNIKPFINKYNSKVINYPSKIDDWQTFEKNNPTIGLNILYIKKKK